MMGSSGQITVVVAVVSLCSLLLGTTATKRSDLVRDVAAAAVASEDDGEGGPPRFHSASRREYGSIRRQRMPSDFVEFLNHRDEMEFHQVRTRYQASPSIDLWKELSASYAKVTKVKRQWSSRRNVQRQGRARWLQTALLDPPEFRPLTANANLMNARCVPWSRQGFDLTQTVVIPEGTCVEMDIGGALLLPQGLDIRGRLAFFGTVRQRLTIRTSFVLVQGILSLYNPENIPTLINNSVRFILEGDNNIFLQPHEENAHLCPEATSCNVGSKPFVIAGGQLDVQSFPTAGADEMDCATWVHPQRATTAPLHIPTASARREQTFQPAPSSCSASNDAVILVESNFDDGTTQGWRTNVAQLSVETDSTNDSPYLFMSQRQSQWDDFIMELDPDCLLPHVVYLFQARIRLTSASGSSVKSLCSQSDENCPSVNLQWDLVGGERDRKWLTTYNQDRSPEDGEWFDIHTTFTLTEEEAVTNQYSQFRLDVGYGPETSLNLSLDNVVLQRLPQAFFSPNPCRELIPHGDFEFNLLANTHPYPFATLWSTLVTVETQSGGGRNRFLRVSQRINPWGIPDYQLPSGCIQAATTYRLSFRYRRWSDISGRVHVRLALLRNKNDNEMEKQVIVECPRATTSSGWVSCSSLLSFTRDHQEAAELWLDFGEDTAGEEEGPYWADLDFDDVSLEFVAGPLISMTLPAEKVQCWGHGANVLLTSPTMSHQHTSVLTIDTLSVSTGVVTFVEPDILAPPTLAETNDYPVEVALLTRNTVIQSAVTDDVTKGGHLIVYFTPQVEQVLQGVEFRFMGQQGIRGRYPIHLHISRDMTNSVISKNVIRDSNQRCVVVHASDNVEISDNIAYNTHGHCFMCEEGGERGNVFFHNLGAVTRSADRLISSMDTDDQPATFWSPAPPNEWKRNVAAGSDGSGFWFENHGDVFGETAAIFSDVNTFEEPLLAFEGNVAHSNERHGIRTYPNGYLPLVRAEFTDCKSYRNQRAGLFFHQSANLRVEGGVYADNQIQIQIHRADDVQVDNVDVIGVSEEGKEAMGKHLDADRICPSSWRTVHGISIHSFVRNYKLLGPTLTNVRFHNLGEDETNCENSTALFIHDDETREDHFDSQTLFEGLEFSRSFPVIDACAVKKAGIQDVSLEDGDGSIIPNGRPGFLMSDTELMTSFLGSGACQSFQESCLLSCPDVCVRTVEFRFDHTSRGKLHLRVSKSGKTLLTPPLDGYVSEWRVGTDSFHGRLSATLPSGHYQMAIVDDDGNPTWPLYVNFDAGKDPLCEDNAITFDLMQPSRTNCDNLILNGDVESGKLDYWKHSGTGMALFIPGKESEFAIASASFDTNRLGQHFDSRCMIVGAVYVVEVAVKLVNKKGKVLSCGTKKSRCPKATLKINSSDDDDVSYRTVARTIASAPNDNNDWRTIHGSFTVTPDMADANRIFFYLEDGPTRLVADNLSIRPRDPDSPIVMNGDFESGDSRFWMRSWDYQYELAVVSPGANGSRFALRTTGRKETWTGLIYPVVNHKQVLQEGRDYEFKAQYKLVKGKKGKAVKCNPNVTAGKKVCPRLAIRTKTGEDTKWEEFEVAVAPFVKKQWNDLQGTFTATAFHMDADEFQLRIQAVKKKVDIILDNVSVVAL